MHVYVEEKMWLMGLMFVHPETELRSKFSYCFMYSHADRWEKPMELSVIFDIHECILMDTGSLCLFLFFYICNKG